MYYSIQSIINNHLQIQSILEHPKDQSLGHFALPTFSFAKLYKQSPQTIAQDFANKLQSCQAIMGAHAIGGYVNFFVSPAFLESHIPCFLNPKPKPKSQKILLEYVSANPTGPLHIGHARGAIFGSCLAKIGRYLGYDITTEYYINDAGSQIENLGLSIYQAGRHLFYQEPYALLDGCYQGDYIFDLAKAAHQELKDPFQSSANIEKLSLFGKDKMLQEIKDDLALAGIYFDLFVSEKELYPRWDQTLKKLTQGLYTKDAKIWLNSTKYGDQKDRVIVRENGQPTYLAGDIIYHDDKFLRNYDWYINIWGADHHGYIARIRAAIEFLGHDSQKLEVILSQMVALLKDGEAYKMSKRAGHFLLMKEVIEEIGLDALRLIFLSKKIDTHLEFDIQDLKKCDASNPVYYINYAHARIHTLLSKSTHSLQSIQDQSLHNLSSQLRDLLVLAFGLSKVIEDSFHQKAPQKIVEYLKMLSAHFHHFYNEERILNTQQEKQALKVLWLVATSIKRGLSLLGVNAKTHM